MQTAFFKPKMHNPNIRNLFHCGQMTVPGPGIPPSLYSGKIAAQLINEQVRKLANTSPGGKVSISDID
jgi:phytoene desaturase